MKMLAQALKLLKIEERDSKIYQFEVYMEKILWWNDKVNLTSIVDPAEFEMKHFVDSLLAAELEIFAESRHIVDIGTGGGFPGIPLAIAYPDKRFLLVDSLRKRMNIVGEIIAETGLANVDVLHSRAEDLGRSKKYRERFDLCVSRAVADLAVLSEYCLPLVKVGGNVVAYKGPDVSREAARSEKAVKRLGGSSPKIVKPNMAEALDGFHLDHLLVQIEKKRKTPSAYPRKAGTPVRAPII